MPLRRSIGAAGPRGDAVLAVRAPGIFCRHRLYSAINLLITLENRGLRDLARALLKTADI
jgi:hypothetical protein